jgi:rod shape-determining protein MreC
MRHGWQLSLGRDVAAFILLVILSLGIMALDRLGEEFHVSGQLARVFFPFQNLASALVRISFIYRENHFLRAQLTELSSQNALLREQVHELPRLRALLDFSQLHPDTLECSRVVMQVDERMGGGLVIDKGSNSGLARNMTVISTSGLVGRIVKVRRDASLVRRIVDPGYRVSALTQRTRAVGILGSGIDGRLVMEWVSPNAEVVPGDTVISSGLGSITPKGVLIGRVSEVSQRPESFSVSLEVEPFVDFRLLEEVFVIKREPPDYQSLFEPDQT